MDSGSVALGSSVIELYGSADVEHHETIYANQIFRSYSLLPILVI
jgi:hypothetical protein